jgi:hypothetical protein
MEQIDVIITEDGKIQVSVKGVKGKKCVEATKFIEEISGGKVLRQEKTREYNEREDDQRAHIRRR